MKLYGIQLEMLAPVKRTFFVVAENEVLALHLAIQRNQQNNPHELRPLMLDCQEFDHHG